MRAGVDTAEGRRRAGFRVRSLYATEKMKPFISIQLATTWISNALELEMKLAGEKVALVQSAPGMHWGQPQHEFRFRQYRAVTWRGNSWLGCYRSAIALP